MVRNAAGRCIRSTRSRLASPDRRPEFVSHYNIYAPLIMSAPGYSSGRPLRHAGRAAAEALRPISATSGLASLPGDRGWARPRRSSSRSRWYSFSCFLAAAVRKLVDALPWSYLSVPLALFAGVLALVAAGHAARRLSEIGLVMLIGLARRTPS